MKQVECTECGEVYFSGSRRWFDWVCNYCKEEKKKNTKELYCKTCGQVKNKSEFYANTSQSVLDTKTHCKECESKRKAKKYRIDKIKQRVEARKNG